MGSGKKRGEKPAASGVRCNVLLWHGYQAWSARTLRATRLGVSRGRGKDVIRLLFQICGPVALTGPHPV